MDVKSFFKNRAVQVAGGVAAFLCLLNLIFGSVFSALFYVALFSGIAFGGQLAYKHIYKPWKTQRDMLSRIKTRNPHAYDEQEVQRKVAQMMKNRR